MLYPAESLLDIIPKIEVAKAGGMLPPGATNVPFTLDTDGASVVWDVPIDFFPTYRGDVFYYEAPPTMIRQATELETFRAIVGNQLSAQYPLGMVRRKLIDEIKLPDFPAPEVWDEFRSQDNNAFYHVNHVFHLQIPHDRIQLVRDRSAVFYLKGKVPLLADYGERFSRSYPWFVKYKDKLFNYPVELIKRRKLASQLIRILIELAKTPVQSVTLTEWTPTFPGQVQYVYPTIGAHTGRIPDQLDPIPIQETPYFIPQPLLPAPEEEKDAPAILALQNRVFPYPDDAVSEVRRTQASYILNGIYVPAGVGQTDWDQMSRYATRALEGFKTAIELSLAWLCGHNVKRFRLPASMGGGEKYIAIVPYYPLFESATHVNDDICFIGMPFEYLLYALYPTGVFPLAPWMSGFVFGAPGVFNFVSKENDYGDAVLKDSEDFERMLNLGWEDTSTFCSARAPHGQILSSAGVAITYPLIAQSHMRAQDVVRISSPSFLIDGLTDFPEAASKNNNEDENGKFLRPRGRPRKK